MNEHSAPRAAIIVLRVLFVMFSTFFALGLLPFLAAMMGGGESWLLNRIFVFFWVNTAHVWFSLGAPEAIVSTAGHVAHFSTFGYCLAYLIPATVFGAASWVLNRREDKKVKEHASHP